MARFIDIEDWEAKTDQDESVWRWHLSRLFSDQLKAMTERAKEVNWQAVADEVNKFITTEDLQELYDQKYLEQGQKYYQEVRGKVEKRWRADMKLKELDPNDPYFQIITRFINDPVNGTASRVRSVTKQSRVLAQSFIRQAVEQSIQEGEGIQNQSKRIERSVANSWKIYGKFRSARIARTEVAILSNKASRVGAEATGVEYRKQWMAFLDNRTRDAHREANNKSVGKNEKFLIGIDRMEGPGDETASAGNIINCRCRLAYLVD